PLPERSARRCPKASATPRFPPELPSLRSRRLIADRAEAVRCPADNLTGAAGHRQSRIAECETNGPICCLLQSSSCSRIARIVWILGDGRDEPATTRESRA